MPRLPASNFDPHAPARSRLGLGRISLAVGQMCAIDIAPPVKARMLRELAVWYRAFATRAANPIIWEARLLTAEDLDAEASRIERQAVPDTAKP